MYHAPLALQCIHGCSDGENMDGEEGRERRLPGLLYADDLALCSEAEDDLHAMLGRLSRCVGGGLKVKYLGCILDESGTDETV